MPAQVSWVERLAVIKYLWPWGGRFAELLYLTGDLCDLSMSV